MTDARGPDGPAADRGPAPPADDRSSLSAAFGGRAGILDVGLPGVLFVLTYTLAGRDLRLALIVAVGTAAVLAVIRIVRKQSLQHAIGGFVGVGIAALLAGRTGRPQDYYLPGLLLNAGWVLGLTISIVLRAPVVGLFLSLLNQAGLSWRRDPVLLRAYTRASWVLAAAFALRLVVQVPLFLAGEDAVGALGAARLAMGLPLYLLALWVSYRVMRASIPEGRSVLPQPKEPLGDPDESRAMG